MYEEQIHAYFDDPKARETLISAISRLVAVKSVRGEAQPGMPYGPGPAAALAEGEISAPIQSPYGYHIILRLPLNPSDYRTDYIADRMAQLQQGWLDANPPQPTEELEKIAPSEFYGKLQSLRAAVQEELEALAPDSSASGSGSSAGSSAG